jgi:hypothetical protein
MSALTTLESTFGGELIAPGDPGYDDARGLFNGAIDKRPALIARCAGPADVRIALAHRARARACRRGARRRPFGGGALELRRRDRYRHRPDEGNRHRPRGPHGALRCGLTWGELDAATQRHGLAVTGGRVTHTGIAGLTLRSGSGWIERKYGSTCENLISAQVVTADGRVLRASADENAHLLWGLKGGGGNFGVVTEFEFRLHPSGRCCSAG